MIYLLMKNNKLLYIFDKKPTIDKIIEFVKIKGLTFTDLKKLYQGKEIIYKNNIYKLKKEGLYQ